MYLVSIINITLFSIHQSPLGDTYYKIFFITFKPTVSIFLLQAEKKQHPINVYLIYILIHKDFFLSYQYLPICVL